MRCDFAEHIIDKGTVEIDIADLAFAIKQVCIDLFFLEANQELVCFENVGEKKDCIG